MFSKEKNKISVKWIKLIKKIKNNPTFLLRVPPVWLSRVDTLVFQCMSSKLQRNVSIEEKERKLRDKNMENRKWNHLGEYGRQPAVLSCCLPGAWCREADCLNTRARGPVRYDAQLPRAVDRLVSAFGPNTRLLHTSATVTLFLLRLYGKRKWYPFRTSSPLSLMLHSVMT